MSRPAPRTSTRPIQRHVFPDGELATPGATIRRAEAAGFETRDLESLREHYALTLRHWVRRLEARSTEATALVGERTYRVWRLYMAGFTQGFASCSHDGHEPSALRRPRPFVQHDLVGGGRTRPSSAAGTASLTSFRADHHASVGTRPGGRKRW